MNWTRRDWMCLGFAGATAAQQTFLTGVSAGVQGEDGLPRLAGELASLGIRHLETSGGGTRLLDLYAGRAPDLGNLKLVGYAQYSNMADPAQRSALIDLHLRIAKFIQPLGGRYITQLWTTPERPDYRNFAANVNQIGKRLLSETGLRIGYHAEREDVSAGMLDRVMESTDPRYFGLVADVGHMQAGGLDPLLICRKYRSRIIAVHLRDYDPNARAFLPLGKGVINLTGLIAYLRETGFTGSVNAEGGGIAASRDYMVHHLGLEL